MVCGVCGVVWCGVVWCGVVWCAVWCVQSPAVDGRPSSLCAVLMGAAANRSSRGVGQRASCARVANPLYPLVRSSSA